MKYRQIMKSAVLAVMLAAALMISAYGADIDADHPLVSEGSLDLAIDLNVDEDYPWAYNETRSSTGYDAYVAGNSGTSVKCVSNLAVTVTEAGVLSFDYRTATPGSSYKLCYSWDAPVTSDNPGTTLSSGSASWTSKSLTITDSILGEDGTATLYIAYLRGGTSSTGSNFCAVANFFMESGSRTLTLDVIGDGTVTGVTQDGEELNNDGSYLSGTVLTLTAESSGDRFYGWVDGNGAFLGNEESCTVTLNSDVTMQAVFGLDGTYSMRKNGTFYEDGTALSAVLSESKYGDEIEILTDDLTLTENATIPSGVTLYVPYSEQYNAEGHENGGGSSLDSAYVYCKLTVPDNVTLTVKGTLRLGGVMSNLAHNYQGHTSGAYGALVNDGSIRVSSSGILDVWGYVTGTGTVTALSGAEVYEPFIVCDYSGGSNTSYLYTANQPPFKRYSMQNIQCTLTLEAGSALYGHCNLAAVGDYNTTDSPIVGPDDGLYITGSNTTVTRTYDADMALVNGPRGTAGIGRTTWTVTGGMTFQYLTIDLDFATVKTSGVDFPIPYNMAFVLEDGVYNVTGRLKLMPGAEMTVAEDAELNISGWFYVMDGLKQGAMSGAQYPTSDQLQAKGYSASAILTVDGTLTVDGSSVTVDGVSQAARFGGVVQTTGDTGVIVTGESAVLSMTGLQDGGKGYYSDNTMLFDLTARVNLDGTLTALEAGQTYYAAGADAFTLESYTVTWCSNGTDTSSDDYTTNGAAMTTVTVTINEAMTGAWSTDSTETPDSDITLVCATYYDSTDASRVSASISEDSDGSQSLTVTRNDAAYAHLVTATVDGVEQTLTAETDGTYTVPEGATAITITSVLIGDVYLDGKFNAKDSTLLAQGRAGTKTLTELQSVAADCDQNGKIAAKDITLLAQYLAGKRTTPYVD